MTRPRVALVHDYLTQLGGAERVALEMTRAFPGAPLYATIRELAMSYFEHYYNPAGERTLRTYSRPVNLTRFDRMGWMTAERCDMGDFHNSIGRIPHLALTGITPSRKWRVGAGQVQFGRL